MIVAAALAALVLRGQNAPIEIPFRIADDALLVDVTVNDTKVSLVFDTGFGGTVLVDDKVDIGPSGGSTVLRDFVGEFEAKTVKITSLKLGPITIPSAGMTAVQESLEGMTEGYNMHTDGLIGLNAIKNFVTEFDFEHQKLILYPKSEDITKRTPDGKKTFLAKLLPIGNTSMQMLVSVPSGRTMVMALDTGNSFYATTHRDVLERVGLWPANKDPMFMKMSGIASGQVDSWSLRMPTLKVFGIPVENSVWSIIDLPSGSAESDGTVGFQFLRNFNFTVDFDRRRVWFENFTGETGNDPVAETGLSGGYRDKTGKVEVWRVMPGSPAAIAGIKKGDEVISVDDRDLAGATTFRRFEALMQGDPGTVVDVVVSRGGNLMRYELKRAFLVNEATGTKPVSLGRRDSVG